MIRQTSGRGASAEDPTVPFVAVVDDDPAVLEALDSLLRSISLATRLFGSPAELLAAQLPDAPGCIVLDVRLPGVSGLDFQGQLVERGIGRPIVFMTGHGDIPMSVRAMKAGAVEFLTKPFREEDLIAAIQQAIERDRTAMQERTELAELRMRFEKLTSRERDVLALVVTGRLNKEIAAQLGTGEQTVKVHRGRVMQKLGAGSVAELVRLVGRVAGQPWAPEGSPAGPGGSSPSEPGAGELPPALRK